MMETSPPPAYSPKPSRSSSATKKLDCVIYKGHSRKESFDHFVLVRKIVADWCYPCQQLPLPSKALVLYDRFWSWAAERQTATKDLRPVLRKSEVLAVVELGPTLSIQWRNLVRAVSRLQGSPVRLSALIAAGTRMDRSTERTYGLKTATQAKWLNGGLLVRTTSYALAHNVLKTDWERNGVWSALPTCAHCYGSATLSQWFIAARELRVQRRERFQGLVLKCALCPSEYCVSIALRSPCHFPDGGSSARIKDLEDNKAWIVQFTRWTDLGPCSSLHNLQEVLRHNNTVSGPAHWGEDGTSVPGDIHSAFEGSSIESGRKRGQLLKPLTSVNAETPSWPDIIRTAQHRSLPMPIRCAHGLKYDVSHSYCVDVEGADCCPKSNGNTSPRE